jgi:hypothetical protein
MYIFLIFLVAAPSKWDFNVGYHIQEDDVASQGREVGIYLKNNYNKNILLATNTAGSIPYYSELPIVDMLGLNDPVIGHRKVNTMGRGMAGHEKGDGAYIIGKKPDLIQFGSSLGSETPVFLSDHELMQQPEFHADYELIREKIDETLEVLFYRRKDFTR